MNALRSILAAFAGPAFWAVFGSGLVMGQEQSIKEVSPGTPSVPVEIAQSLASANAAVDTLREENAQLKLQTEALGLAGLKPELRPLQERLIAALADYRLAERRAKELTERIVSLSEAAIPFVGDLHDGASRTRLQQELSAANKSIVDGKAETSIPPVALDSAKVISLKDDLGLAVINTGSESGLRLGTPMRIVRAEQTVATGLVVDVRGRFAGVLMTSANSAGTLRVGDQAKPETISTLK
jgi:hypothetical protein